MPRSATPVAALLLSLALGSFGCKPSSLTPFWIGTQEQEVSGANINGIWVGATANGGAVRFQVGNNQISSIVLDHRDPGCAWRFEISQEKQTIVDSEFSIGVALETQGIFIIAGRFDSSTLCTGGYYFESLPVASTCPTTGSGQFTVRKQ